MYSRWVLLHVHPVLLAVSPNTWMRACKSLYIRTKCTDHRESPAHTGNVGRGWVLVAQIVVGYIYGSRGHVQGHMSARSPRAMSESGIGIEGVPRPLEMGMWQPQKLIVQLQLIFYQENRHGSHPGRGQRAEGRWQPAVKSHRKYCCDHGHSATQPT